MKWRVDKDGLAHADPSAPGDGCGGKPFVFTALCKVWLTDLGDEDTANHKKCKVCRKKYQRSK